MGVFSALKGFANHRRQMTYAKMMNGMVPVFSSFGNDVYASDIVKNAIRCISAEMSKLNPQHIRVDPNGMQHVVNSDINRLLKYGPNPLMSTSDFLEKIVYMRERYNNVYIYPQYERIPLGKGKYKRKYTAFYPLNPMEVEYLEEESGKLWVKFTFANGYNYTMPYEDIIHWRKDFTENDFVGGDAQGNPDNRAELKLLETDDTILQGIGKGVKASLGVRGIVKIQKMLDDEKQEKEREKFEKKLSESKSGLLTIDLKNDFIPIKLDPKVIDKDTIEFVATRVLAKYGVSLAIYNGDYTDEQYQAFYEKTLEGMVISLGRVFSKVLFTDRELDMGNEIIFYNQGLMFTSMSNKIKAVDILTKLGTLTDNQVLNIFGYPPFDGGDIRHMSLNYINREIADNYQLSKNKGKESTNDE